MKKITIRAVEMVRRIRDAHNEQLRGKSPEERFAFLNGMLRAADSAQHDNAAPICKDNFSPY